MEEHDTQENSTEQSPKDTQRRSIWLVGGLTGGLAILLIALGVIFLPKLIRTPDRVVGPGELGTPLPTETPTATATPTATPTVTPTPLASTPVAVEPAEGWTFEGVRVQPDPGLGGLLIYGEAINNSGAPQSILGLQGTFYDAQGGAITPQKISDYWPIETVPPGWRMPFELTLIGPTAVDRVELRVTTEESDEPLRTDFEVSQLTGADVESEFCVTGRARNLGQPLDRFLMVVGVLYDADGRVINWGTGYQRATADLTGDNTVVVSACAQRYNHNVARYELRAWGE
jgi:hypothetical protein